MIKVNKALSIRQPWLWLIINGYKNIEIRSWKASTFEYIALHSSQSFDKQALKYLHEVKKIRMPLDLDSYSFGDIRAIAKIDGYIPFNSKPDFYLYRNRHHNDPSWWRGKCYGWVLEDVRLVHPVNDVKGQLGLFKIDDIIINNEKVEKNVE